jgi:KTSC domain-containing protein
MSERVALTSTAIRAVGYRDGALDVEFTSGAVYRYFGVPRRLYDELLRAESHGSFFSQHIRDRFRYALV